MAWPETVRKEDLEITYYRGSGAGGQRRNKVATACRIRHVPTGTVAQAEEHAKQGQNKKAAFRRLAAQLIPLMNEAAKEAAGRDDTDLPDSNNERIRTYNETRSSVKDHRTGKVYEYKDVLNGKGLEDILTDIFESKAAEKEE